MNCRWNDGFYSFHYSLILKLMDWTIIYMTSIMNVKCIEVINLTQQITH